MGSRCHWCSWACPSNCGQFSYTLSRRFCVFHWRVFILQPKGWARLTMGQARHAEGKVNISRNDPPTMSDGELWNKTAPSLSLHGKTLRLLSQPLGVCSEIEPRLFRAIACSIGFLPLPGSPPHSTLRASWEHFPKELLVTKSLSQDLFWGKPILRISTILKTL